MKAQIGGTVERWDGKERTVLHVFPFDEDEAAAGDAIARLGGKRRTARDLWPTLCGERHPIRFGWLDNVPPPPNVVWCPTCERLDRERVMRLP